MLLAHETPYIFMLALLFMESICSDFLFSWLHPVVKLPTFLFSFLLREYFIACIQNSLSPWWSAVDARRGQIKHSDQVRNLRLHHLRTCKRHVKKRGEKKNCLDGGKRKKSNYFWIKMGNLWAFQLCAFPARKSHLLFAIALCYHLRFPKGSISQVIRTFALRRKFKLTSICL